MQAHNDKLLQLLGCKDGSKAVCSLHKRRTPLSVRENTDTGTAWFSCAECGFYGDSIALAAAVKGIAVAEAVRLFEAGGSLAECLKEPLTVCEAAAIAEARADQHKIQVYMAACRLALNKTPDRARFRIGIGSTTAHMVPREMGLIVRGGDTPAPFKSFDKPKLAATNHIVYPYTYNGEVTCARIQNSSERSTVLVNVARTDIGVFMEKFDKAPEVLVVTSDPVAAAILYGNWTVECTLKPPLVAAVGFPLPESLAGIKALRLLSTPDTPIRLGFVLQALSAHPVSGGTIAPAVHVWWYMQGPEQIKAEHLRAAVTSDAGTMTPADLWAVRELGRLVETGRVEDAYREITDAGLDDSTRARLRVLAAVEAPAAVEVLNADTRPAARRLSLANGRVICVAETSITTCRFDGEEILVNAGITVSHKLRTYKGSEAYICEVRPEDPTMPTLKASVPGDGTMSSEFLQQCLMAPYAEAGLTPYITAYSRTGFAFRDVMARLAEGCEVRSEVKALGPDSHLDIHLPNMVVRPDAGVIEPQHQIYTLPRPVLQAYGAVTYADTGVDAYRELLAGCDNLYVAAFTQGLLHVVHEATNALRPALRGQPWTPEHLLYVETESGIWEPIFRQLAELFSGTDFLPSVGFTDALASVTAYKQLGTLPLIASIPALRGNQFPRLMVESPLSIVGLVDNATAVMTGGDLRTTFVTPACDKPATVCTLDQNHLVRLRDQFGAFLLRLSQTPHWHLHKFKPPARAVYASACAMLDVTPSPLMARIAHRYLMTAGYQGADAFFDAVHAALNASGAARLGVVHGEPPDDASFTARGQRIFVMPDCVMVTHSVLSAINRTKDKASRFERTALTQELGERDLLIRAPTRLDIDTNRCWVFDRKTWDVLIVRPPLRIPNFMVPSSIQLKTIA